MLPKVSVVIPTYNRAHFIGEAIRSVIAQTYPDFELIVVDDGSTDNTREVVKEFGDPRIRYIYQPNRGVKNAQNTGILAAHGEYLTILGDDDLFLPRSLELRVNVLESRPDVTIVSSDAYTFDNSSGKVLGRFWEGRPVPKNLPPSETSRWAFRKTLAGSHFLMAQASMVRREVFDEIGLFDEVNPCHDDWDMLARIVRRFPMAIIDEPLTMLRRHDNNMSSNNYLMLQAELANCDKAFTSYSLSPEETRIVKGFRERTLRRFGVKLLGDGRIAEGREKLREAIRANPWRIIPYIFLIGSYLGLGVINTAKIWRRRLQGR